MPESLFKYLTAASATAVLANRKLRWSTCTMFNDPADMQIDLRVDFDVERVTQLTLEKMWARIEREGEALEHENAVAAALERTKEHWRRVGSIGFRTAFVPGIHASLQKIRNATKTFCDEMRGPLAMTKVVCFSARRDSTLMWSHYAESHAGLVLEFANAEGFDSPYHLAKEVIYSNEAPALGTEEEIASILAGEGRLGREIFERMVFTKSDDWQYEQEWRLQTGDGREPGRPFEDVPFAAEELRSVYFGAKTSQATLNLLLPLLAASYPSTEVWKARRESHTYELVFDRIR